MDNVIIRKAKPEEAETIIDLNIKVWNSTYKGLIPQEIIDKLQSKDNNRIESMKQRIQNDHNIIVAQLNGKIIGYYSFGPSNDEKYQDSGQIYAGYILKEYQGLGIGRKIALVCMTELQEKGYHTLITKCLENNPFNSFHKSLGGIYMGEDSFDPMGLHVGMENVYYHDNLEKSIELNKKKLEIKSEQKLSK